MIKLGINHHLYSEVFVLLGRFNLRKHKLTNFQDICTEKKTAKHYFNMILQKKCVQSFCHTMWANTIYGNKRSLHAATQRTFKGPAQE